MRPGQTPVETAVEEVAGVSLPVLDDFPDVADPANYAALPDDWAVGVCDVVDSGAAIARGRYKAVNLAGAGSISAVANALEGGLRIFAFGGDGAAFAVPPGQRSPAAEALAHAAAWARRDLGLELRVGMTTVGEIRAAGHDLRAAFWRASDDVRYAMFIGGGVDWAEARLKQGAIGLPPARPDAEPDLSGLSCRFGPIMPVQGMVLSLIVKPASGATGPGFAQTARRVVRILEQAGTLNPVPSAGPETHWPSAATIGLNARIASGRRSRLARWASAFVFTLTAWLVFRLNLSIGRFDPARYRREVAANTDFRKFSDGLMMTVDCTPRTAARVRRVLAAAAAKGVVRYGLHLQDEALMTCIVPSALTADHMHFIDGAGGGYASAARQMREDPGPSAEGPGDAARMAA